MDLACNITDPGACGVGACESYRKATRCVCDSLYDPLTNCTVLIHDALGGADAVMWALAAVAMLAMMVLLSFELFVDRAAGRLRVRWANTLLVVKAFLFISLGIQCGRACYLCYNAVTQTPAADIANGILSTLASLPLTVAYTMMVINWFAIIQRVKQLSMQVRGLDRMRKVTWGFLFVAFPIYAVLSILTAVDVGRPVSTYLNHGIATLILLFICISSTYFMIRTWWALRQQDGTNHRVEKARRKTKWICMVTIGYWVVLSNAIGSILYPPGVRPPWVWFGMKVYSIGLSFALTYVGTLMFVRDYTWQNLWQALRGDPVALPSDSTHVTTPTVSVSGRSITESGLVFSADDDGGDQSPSSSSFSRGSTSATA